MTSRNLYLSQALNSSLREPGIDQIPIFIPEPLRAVCVFFHPWHPVGWAGCQTPGKISRCAKVILGGDIDWDAGVQHHGVTLM